MSFSTVHDVVRYEALCYKARTALEMIAGSSYETKHFLRTFRNGAYVPVWEHACKVTHFHWELDGDIEWLTRQVDEIVAIALEELRNRKAYTYIGGALVSDQDYYRTMYDVHKCEMYGARLIGTTEGSVAKRMLIAARDIAKSIAHQEESPIETFWEAEADIVDMMVSYHDSDFYLNTLIERKNFVESIRDDIQNGVDHHDKIKWYARTYLEGHLSVQKLLSSEQWSPMSTMSDTDTLDTYQPASGIYVPPHARLSQSKVPDATYTDLKRGTPYQMYVMVGREVFTARNVGYVRYALKKRMAVYSMMGGKRIPYDHATQVAWETRNAVRLKSHETEHRISERRAPGEMRLL